MDLQDAFDKYSENAHSQTSKHNRKTVDITSTAGRSAKLASKSPYAELRKQADLVSEANSQRKFLYQQGAATYSHQNKNYIDDRVSRHSKISKVDLKSAQTQKFSDLAHKYQNQHFEEGGKLGVQYVEPN